MDGLRKFIEADNHSAVVAGDPRRGTKSVQVKKPKRCGRTRSARSGLSLTQSTSSLRGGDRRWLTQTGTLSAKQSTKELKGKNGKSCIITTEKPSESQKAKVV